MKHIFRHIAILICTLLSWNPSFGEIFNTSKTFDLLCSPQYIDHLKEDTRFAELCSDSVFIASISEINMEKSEHADTAGRVIRR